MDQRLRCQRSGAVVDDDRLGGQRPEPVPHRVLPGLSPRYKSDATTPKERAGRVEMFGRESHDDRRAAGRDQGVYRPGYRRAARKDTQLLRGGRRIGAGALAAACRDDDRRR